MELSWKQRDPRWNPRWNSDGSRGIRDVIQDGAQMELRWSSDGVQTEAKEAKIASQDRIQAIQVTQVIPEEIPGT